MSNNSLLKQWRDLAYGQEMQGKKGERTIIFENQTTYKKFTYDLGIENTEKQEEVKAKEEENADMLKSMADFLGESVSKVVLSKRLKSHPVCISSEGEITLEMEKVLNSMPGDQKVKAQRVLEINPDHEIFGKLTAVSSDSEKLEKYAKLLYTQALLIEGMPVENPVEFSNLICELM